MIDKPDRIFDRDVEWGHLAAFASRATDRPQLGVVLGVGQARRLEDSSIALQEWLDERAECGGTSA